MNPWRPSFLALIRFRFPGGTASMLRMSPSVCALLLAACLVSQDDRIAGSSTEAGNAGGKLSLSDGRPAAGVAVTLVARDFLPDTLGRNGSGDIAGSYYRTRTGPDGRFRFSAVAPGNYRVMAVEAFQGATADSVAVKPGGDTILFDNVMRPLGGISGIAKVVGLSPSAKVNIWVRPKSTLKQPPRADATGAFNLDSLPEGEYELVPQCFSCQPVTHGVRVRVKSGEVTTLSDTLKLYPEYFFGFPDSGDLVLRTAWLPLSIGGKINRGAEERKNPTSVTWTWNGNVIHGKDLASPDGVSETTVMVDSGWFSGTGPGRLRLVLNYPDTAITREWRMVLDSTDTIWPLSAVSAMGAVRIPGPVNRSVWRVHVTDNRPLDSASAAFWGLWPAIPATASALPEWIDLGAEDAEMSELSASDTARFTFFLVPDRVMGGRVFRVRRHERIEDAAKIRYLEKARFGFTDSLEPSMLPAGLVVDRRRGPSILQRYRVDSTGAVQELLGKLTDAPALAGTGALFESPLFFFRSGAIDAGYSWDQPLRGAAKALAVTHEGLAVRLDGSQPAVRLAPAELDSLKRILSPLTDDSHVLSDTETFVAKGTLQYLLAGRRGVLTLSGEPSSSAGLVSSIHAWMVRNGLEVPARYPLTPGSSRWLGFQADSSGLRYSGDTVVLELADSADGVIAREYLSFGSPGHALDSISARYFLAVDGDSLVAYSNDGANSRLFGKLDERRAVFALTGLQMVSADLAWGIPRLSGGGNMLSGVLGSDLEILGRVVSRPAVHLDGRPILEGRQGKGFLYTPEGGLERSWRFDGASGTLQGWDRE
jgi:hypothetical protein